MLTTTIVIATFNRPSSLNKLVTELIKSKPQPHQIVIVDSSPTVNIEIQRYESVVYVHSLRQNQPYQRYLGYHVSDGDIVVYLDDDMEVLDKEWLKYIAEQFADASVVGVAINFKNDNDFLQYQLPKSKLRKFNQSSKLKQFIKTLSGYPQPVPGCFWLCGIRGHQPKGGGKTQWVSGGAFAVRKNVLYKNFNFKMLNLFERKIGMGEDAILGFTLAQHGEVIYMPKEYFYHNDQKDSTYTVDLYSYGKRVAYSRLYLSYEYSRLIGKSKTIAFIHFNWYMLWRLIGMAVNQIIDYKPARTQIIKGYLKGYLLAVKEYRYLAKYNSADSWNQEVRHDTKL